MKKILYLTGLLVTMFVRGSYAQSNQSSNPAVVGIDGFDIPKDAIGVLSAIVENNGSDPMPIGTFRVYIGIDPSKLEFVDPSTYITANYPDWTVVSLTSGILTLVNGNGEISPSELMSFEIKVKPLDAAPLGSAALSLRVGLAPGQGSNAGNADASTADDNTPGAVNIAAALPVTLISFSTVREGNTGLLTWSTTQETNSDRFEIERSLNGKQWNRIGTLASHGESSSLKHYTYRDTEPADGENLYRLRMVDKDMTFAYSRIQSVTFDGLGKDLSVYPNPSSDKIHIRDYQNVKQVSILDLKGNVVYRTTEIQQGEVSLRNLMAGTYSVRLSRTDGNQTSQKIVVVK